MGAVIGIASFGTLAPLGAIVAGAISGALAGIANAAITGGNIGQAAWMGAAFGAVGGAAFGTNGTNGFLGKMGPKVGLGLLVAGGAYSAATGNLDSFLGGLAGTIAGIGLTGGFSNNGKQAESSKDNVFGDIRMRLPEDSKDNYLQGVLNSIKDSPTAVAVAAQKVNVIANDTGKTITRNLKPVTYGNDAGLRKTWENAFSDSLNRSLSVGLKGLESLGIGSASVYFGIRHMGPGGGTYSLIVYGIGRITEGFVDIFINAPNGLVSMSDQMSSGLAKMNGGWLVNGYIRASTFDPDPLSNINLSQGR